MKPWRKMIQIKSWFETRWITALDCVELPILLMFRFLYREVIAYHCGQLFHRLSVKVNF
jgi:hypothetical protein